MTRTSPPPKDNQPANNGEGSAPDAPAAPGVSDAVAAADPVADPAAPAPDAATNVGKAGLKAAENHLAETDEEVTMAWDVSGPRSGRIERIGGFIHNGRVVLAVVFKSGKFKIYGPQDAPPAAPPTV